MEDIQERRNGVKKTGKFILILTFSIILVILIASGFAMYAWAKYVNQHNSSAEAEVARWQFDCKILETTQREEVNNFAITRTDDNRNVQDLTLAPGTSGEFVIEINATGTETLLTYNVNIELENRPTNLKLFSDSSKTEEIKVNSNIIDLNRIYVFNR